MRLALDLKIHLSEETGHAGICLCFSCGWRLSQQHRWVSSPTLSSIFALCVFSENTSIIFRPPLLSRWGFSDVQQHDGDKFEREKFGCRARGQVKEIERWRNEGKPCFWGLQVLAETVYMRECSYHTSSVLYFLFHILCSLLPTLCV